MAGDEEQAFTEQAVEAALDSTIAALMVLDGPPLAQLAQLWGAWDVTPLSLSITSQERARLQAKLSLLERLLRQTAISLNLLGLPAALSEQHYTGSSFEQSVEQWQRGA